MKSYKKNAMPLMKASQASALPVHLEIVMTSVGQGFDKPQGYEGNGIKGKGQGQDFHTLVKPLLLTRVFSRVIQG